MLLFQSKSRSFQAHRLSVVRPRSWRLFVPDFHLADLRQLLRRLYADFLNDPVLDLLELLAAELRTLLLSTGKKCQVRDVLFRFILVATYAARKLGHQLLVVLVFKGIFFPLLIQEPFFVAIKDLL